MANISVKCFTSTKDSSKFYTALIVDLGYRSAILTFDFGLLSEITGRSIAELRSMKPGDEFVVGYVDC